MNSAAHRKNILDPALHRVASGVAFDPDGPDCGQFWMTQTFLG